MAISRQYAVGGRRRGFSFVEIMFAVVILGIGFIMVASIFPVALQQSKSTSEETTAASIARGAAGYLSQILTDGASPVSTSNCPPDAVNTAAMTVVTQPFVTFVIPPLPAPPPLWGTLAGNLILPEDPRYGWVFLYRRTGVLATPSTWSPYIQAYFFPVQIRATDVFDSVKDTAGIPTTGLPSAATIANLSAKPVQVAVAEGTEETGFVDVIAFDMTLGHSTPPSAPTKTDNVDAAWENAYVIIADDKNNSTARGRLNGQIFKLGARRKDLDGNATLFYNPAIAGGTPANSQVYELQPGNDFKADPGVDGIPGTADDIVGIGNTQQVPPVLPALQSTVIASGSADAFLIGRGFKPDAVTSPPPYSDLYTDLSMPISAYTTFIKVK